MIFKKYIASTGNSEHSGKLWDLVDGSVAELSSGQVLVKIRAVSLNYRDLLLGRGKHGFPMAPPGRVPVSDGAGEVVEVGPGVSRVKVGDKVAGLYAQTWFGEAHSMDARKNTLGGSVDGVLTQFRLFDEQGVVKVPEHLSFEEAATLPCAAVTAWNALYGLKPVEAGQVVLILGTGGVSTFATQFASAAGARVIVTSSSDQKLEKARGQGATDMINYRSCPDWDIEVLKLAADGVDHVVEVGGAGTLERSLRCIRPGGIISVVGMLAGGAGMDPIQILHRNCILRGVLVGPRAMFEAMNRVISWHKIRPVIDRIFEFQDANAALAYLETGAHVGKVVIQVD